MATRPFAPRKLRPDAPDAAFRRLAAELGLFLMVSKPGHHTLHALRPGVELCEADHLLLPGVVPVLDATSGFERAVCRAAGRPYLGEPPDPVDLYNHLRHNPSAFGRDFGLAWPDHVPEPLPYVPEPTKVPECKKRPASRSA